MDLEILRCGKCDNNYDLKTHIPRLLMKCSHMMCQACIVSLMDPKNDIKCPIDGIIQSLGVKGVESCLIVPTFKHLLEKRAEKSICEEHNEECTFMCLEDQVKLCDSCIDDNKHKDHKIRSLKRLRQEINKENNKGIKAKGIDDNHKEIIKMLEQSEIMSVNVIKCKLEELEAVVRLKKEELISKTRNFFVGERKKLSEGLEYNSIKVCAADKSFEDRNQDKENISPLKEETLTETVTKMKEKLCEKQTQSLKFIIQEISVFLENSLTGQKEILSQFESSVLDLNTKLNMAILKEGKDSKDSTRCESEITSVLSDTASFLKIEHEGEYLVLSAINPSITGQMELEKESPSNPEQLKLAESIYLKLSDHILTENNINKFFSLWKTCEKATTLKIDFKIEKAPENLLVSILPALFWKQKLIKKITVSFDERPVGDNLFIQLFKDIFCQMADLESLTLNLRSTKISDKGLEAFAIYVLPHLHSLNRLQISLCQTQISDHGLIHILNNVNNVKNMKRFAFDLDDTPITDLTIEVLVRKVLPLMTSLEEFELCLSKTRLTDKSVSQLLISIPNVQNFFMSLEGISITSKSIEAFSKITLPKMTNLNSFSMSLRGTKVSDIGIIQLLLNMKNVKILKLYLGSTKVTNNILQAFVKSIGGLKLENLEDFELNLRDTNITDEGMLQLFKSMPNMKIFSLNLAETQITDNTLKAFGSQTLKTMKALRQLRLILWETQVLDEGVVKIFKNLESIRRIEMGLQGTRVTDKSVEAFIQMIPVLKSLENFQIALDSTDVSQKSKNALEEARRAMILHH